MHISTNHITFDERKLKEVLKLDNPSLEKAIYKVRSNNLEAFSISPAKGFIEPQKSIQVLVALKRYSNINAKILFAYAFISNRQQTNFDQAWGGIKEIDIKKQYVQVTCVIQALKQSKIQNALTLKKTESPIYEPQLQKSISSKNQKQESSTLQKKQVQQVPRQPEPLKKSSTNAYQTVRQLPRQTKTLTMVSSRLQRSNTYQGQLKAERERNKKLVQRLTERQKKLQYYQNIAQQRINRSVEQQQPGVPLSNLNICLLVLICILFGFFVARIPPSDPL